MNDDDRQCWVLNDEALYQWWRGSKLSMAAFIKLNRKEIDEHIAQAKKG